jgi:hypothetical protein
MLLSEYYLSRSKINDETAYQSRRRVFAYILLKTAFIATQEQYEIQKSKLIKVRKENRKVQIAVNPVRSAIRRNVSNLFAENVG